LHRGGGEGAGGGELQDEANKTLDDTELPERFDIYVCIFRVPYLSTERDEIVGGWTELLQEACSLYSDQGRDDKLGREWDG
jgi:hypothetical protein